MPASHRLGAFLMREFYGTHKDFIDKAALGLGLALFIYVSVRFLFAYVAPFVFGYVLSAVMEPPARFLCGRLKAPRWLASLICVALVIFVRWNPGLAVLGAFVFGAFRSMNYYIPDSVLSIPPAFYQMLPFLLTIVVLVITGVRKRRGAQPASLGENYFREER